METSPKIETSETTVAPSVDLDYIRRLKILPDCPFDHPPQYDWDGENLAA